ncbi:MAG: uracil-DNA glycosylase [Acidilobaceae archaeon]|nr:uracil-DNA glycosylase [Acidilobaceae archaeon]MCX8166202.1 uracil-DNA glycosylase [Acidilobaceae archaeon]MDW7974840.1 uracil-DNA glycosylase [Sulfolobales archaeon]
MEGLKEIVRACTKCRLHLGRKNAVPGEGPAWARIVLVGEAPGRQEDEEGRPFVGAAGRLLDSLLREAGLRREELYVTNLVKCRPPGNRRPRSDEISACLPYLLSELSALRPALVVALGETAGRSLSQALGIEWRGLGEMRGRKRVGALGGRALALLFTYHPSAALRRRELGDLILKDLTLAAEIARGNPPGDPEDEPHSQDHP